LILREFRAAFSGDEDVTVEQSEPEKTRAAPYGIAEPGLSATSPLRWVFVIVPLLVIAVVGTNLLGLWTTSVPQAARKERLRQAELPPLKKPDPAEGPASIDAPYDAGGKMPSDDDPSGIEPAFDVTVVVALLPAADPEAGAAHFRMCVICHPSERDAPSRIGPGLWGIVGMPKAAQSDYSYSAALQAKGGTWSYEELAEFLHDPRAFAPGNKMAFRGITDNARIADMIAYLRTLSDNPPPLAD
jgi:cytochrome c